MRFPSIIVKHTWAVWVATASGIVLIGAVDYVTGGELRVYPLYHAPISFVAWYRGRPGAGRDRVHLEVVGNGGN